MVPSLSSPYTAIFLSCIVIYCERYPSTLYSLTLFPVSQVQGAAEVGLHSLFFYYYLFIIVLCPIQTTINLHLPHPVFLALLCFYLYLIALLKLFFTHHSHLRPPNDINLLYSISFFKVYIKSHLLLKPFEDVQVHFYGTFQPLLQPQL